MGKVPDNIQKYGMNFIGEATKRELILIWSFVICVFVICGLIAFLTDNIQ